MKAPFTLTFDILLLTSGWDVRVLGSSRPERMETDYGRRCCNELQRRWRRRRRRTFLSLVRRCSSTRDQWCNRSPLQRLLDETDVLEVGTNELNGAASVSKREHMMGRTKAPSSWESSIKPNLW